MAGKPLTVKKMARMGGLARAKAYGKNQLREWGRRGGRPWKLDKAGLARLRRMLRKGVRKAKIARTFDISTRTVTRYVSRTNAEG